MYWGSLWCRLGWLCVVVGGGSKYYRGGGGGGGGGGSKYYDSILTPPVKILYSILTGGHFTTGSKYYTTPAVARPLAAAPAGTTSAVPDCSTNHDSADRISGQFLFYHDHNFTKSKGNLRFRRLVPLFVPIGVCVTTHDDGTASDVTIGLWRHSQKATNHERNGKPWFSLPK